MVEAYGVTPALVHFLKREKVKVILEGTHSTGKTTLLNKLCRALELPAIEEPVRPVFQSWETDASFFDFIEEEIAQVQREIMDLCVQLHEFDEAAVADRSPISVYAYTLARLSRFSHVASIRETLEHCKRMAQRQIALKNCIYVIVPPNIPNALDGCREDQPFYREQIDLLVRGMLDGRLNVHTLNSDKRKGRYAEALHGIEYWAGRMAQRR